MSTADLPLFLVLLPLLVGSGLCSASETALFGLTHADRLRLRAVSPIAERAVATLLAQPRMLLITVLLLNMTVNVLYFVISSVLSMRAEHPLYAVGIAAGSLMCIVLFGEVLPKLLATAHRVGYCRVIAPPFLVAHRVLAPIRIVINTAAVAPASRLVRPPDVRAQARVTPEELDALIRLAAESGAINIDEQRLLGEVVDLASHRTRDVMTPRIDLPWLDKVDGPSRVRELVRDTGRTRLPVRDQADGGRVLGLLSAERYLATVTTHHRHVRAPRIGRFVEPVTFVPDRLSLDRLLEHFQRTGENTVICVDEHGTITGLVSMEDAINELVLVPTGQTAAETGQVRLVGLGQWLVPGRLNARQWAEFFAEAGTLPVGRVRASTVGGLVYAALGRIPSVGDEARYGNVVLRVEEMVGRAVESVSVRIDPDAGAAQASGGER